MTNPSSKRLLSLDVFRGLTIAGMILVNSPGNQTAYAPLDHAEWNGWTPTDLVFPFFVFILGVSLVFSFSKRRGTGQGQRELILQIFRRTLVIFGLGLFLNGFPYYHLDTLRVLGVLQRISLCYFFAALIYLALDAKQIGALVILILAGYWWAMTRIPVPGFGIGNLSKEGNLAAYVDRAILGAHTYRPEYDPEGILSTFPAVASALIGVLTGIFLLSGLGEREKAKSMFIAGLSCFALGEIWSRWFPINKALWTSSYVLLTGGLALMIFSVCYGLIEIKNIRGWSKFFEVFGVNALAAYVVSILDLKIQNRIPVLNPDGTLGNLRLFITRHLFESWMGPLNASLFYALSHTLIWFAILTVLYRKKIFIKI